MRIIDVDAHLHEPLDWVERTDPDLAKQLGRRRVFSTWPMRCSACRTPRCHNCRSSNVRERPGTRCCRVSFNTSR